MGPSLEERFDEAMMNIYRRTKAEAKYDATRFSQMLTEHRGLETARILLHADTVSEGYTALSERGRLDLTVEALIHEHPEYHPLFTDEELAVARRRLTDYKYNGVTDPVEPFIGAFRSDVPDWAAQHDTHLGQSLREELAGRKCNGS